MTYDETVKLYDEIVAKCSDIERKGKSMPYTSDNGHMFSLINKDGELGFRFSKEVQEQYFKEWGSSYLMSHGAKMKGYVQIPTTMFSDLDKLAKYLKESHAYVMSLPKK